MIIEFSDIKVNNLTLNKAVAETEQLINHKEPQLIVTPNPEMIVRAQNDFLLKSIINNAALRLADGISMVVVSKLLKKPLKERVSGIDFMLKLSEQAAKKEYRIFLLGGKLGIAEKAAKQLKESYPGIKIVGIHDGYFEHDGTIITQIKAAKPDILFAGLGAGRQEKWLAKYLNELKVPVSVGIGGAMDVISGYKRRAPNIFQRLYIEWLYRLITEPWRWKRQLALPRFLFLVFKSKLRYNKNNA
ncbi:WecB/TagA/CpsF family glycosyltransferase [Candidatus Margulisiibacteriota bacterium]